MSKFPFSPASPNRFLAERPYAVVVEQSFRKDHTVFNDAPCDWSKERGATHTLYCGDLPGQGTRPARLLKTVMYVGTDEDAQGALVWEKWDLVPTRTLHFQP